MNAFWNRLDRSAGPDSCWRWKGRVDDDGYGRMMWNGKRMRTHRIALSTVRPVPDDLCVCHRCDNPACCNPRHLFLGTHADNVADKVAKGRQARIPGERNGRSKLTREDVMKIRSLGETDLTIREIANGFPVSQSTIGQILRRNLWRDLT